MIDLHKIVVDLDTEIDALKQVRDLLARLSINGAAAGKRRGRPPLWMTKLKQDQASPTASPASAPSETTPVKKARKPLSSAVRARMALAQQKRHKKAKEAKAAAKA